MAQNQAYLGVALRYPISLVKGSPALIAGYDLITQSIINILNTPIGTRLFLPDYGSRIRQLIFEPNDTILEGQLELCIFEAVDKWEGRTKFVSVTFNTSEEKVDCLISHQPLASNEVQSFIFPFYRALKY